MAEYKSAMSPDAYNLAVYDPATGSIMAIEYDKNTEVSQIYTLTASGRDGSALLFSLMPTFAEDEEFAENAEEYRTELSLGLPDIEKAGDIMARIYSATTPIAVSRTMPAPRTSKAEHSTKRAI